MKWKSQDSNVGSLIPRFMLYTSTQDKALIAVLFRREEPGSELCLLLLE
jgi:hypothetical protein